MQTAQRDDQMYWIGLWFVDAVLRDRTRSPDWTGGERRALLDAVKEASFDVVELVPNGFSDPAVCPYQVRGRNGRSPP